MRPCMFPHALLCCQYAVGKMRAAEYIKLGSANLGCSELSNLNDHMNTGAVLAIKSAAILHKFFPKQIQYEKMLYLVKACARNPHFP